MAIGGLHPVLIFRINSADNNINKELADEYNALNSASDKDQASLDRMAVIEKQIKEGIHKGSIPIPLYLDSTLTQSYVRNDASSIQKSFTFFGNRNDNNVAVSSTNEVNLTIEMAKNSSFYNTLVNICTSFASINFAKSLVYANISYFSPDNIIMNGYLTGYSKDRVSAASKDSITLRISDLGDTELDSVGKIAADVDRIIPNLSEISS